MMDKEAQEKIARYMRLRILSEEERTSPDDVAGITPWPELTEGYKRNYWLNEAIPILEIINELGYRKLPEDKPPLLSDDIKGCLDCAREAIVDAICCEDGLDGGAGQRVIRWITDILGDYDEWIKIYSSSPKE